jgi:selenide,water dikinase
VKPLEPFLAWWQQWLASASPLPVRIRGGGAAAMELALAFAERDVRSELLLRGQELGLGSKAANRTAEALLRRAGIKLQRQIAESAPADLACTGSRAPTWLQAAGLPVDPDGSGRVLTEASLQVQGIQGVFASGDCGQIAEATRPASGVWAVRAAAILAINLRRSLKDPRATLRPWHPQRWALQLLGTGGPRGGKSSWPADPNHDQAQASAIALWGPWAVGPHPWLGQWKERIDRQFMASFSDLGAMGGHPPSQTSGPGASRTQTNAMACRGCASKLAGGPLNRALGRLEDALNPAGQSPRDSGEEEGRSQAPQAEDALVIGTSQTGRLLLQSVDGFPALVRDPWLNARLTTLHACSDLWACGATVESVQVLVTVPEGAEALQEELLLQTLAGVRSVLDPLGAGLIGGHTLEGRDGAGLALALTVNGSAEPSRHWRKGPLQEGDVLILSRPIGTGVLFAGAMAGLAEGGWVDQALAVMQQSQAPLVELLAAHDCRACTDVTGFGLLGHLLEMTQGARVRLNATAIPALSGSLALLEQGVASTLAPANAQVLGQLGPDKVISMGAELSSAQLGLLIDPQTCGPLLAAVPADRSTAALAAIQNAGFPQVAIVGEVMNKDKPLI